MSYKAQVLTVYPSARAVRDEYRQWAIVDGNTPRVLTSGWNNVAHAWESVFYALIFTKPEPLPGLGAR